MKIKIDFISPPFSGHLNPLVELAYPLLSNTHYDIRFITGPNKINYLNEMGFNAVPVLPDTPNAMELIANTTKPVKSNPFALLKQLKQVLTRSPQIIEELQNMIRQNNTDIVVADFTAIHAGIACTQLHLPWITTMPTPFAIETNSGPPSYFGGLLYSESVSSKVMHYLARKSVRLFKIIVGFIFRKELKKMNFSIYRKDGNERAYSPYSILGLGIKEFEFNGNWPAHFELIGSCCSVPEPSVVLNLDTHSYDKTVLVTLGTHLEWAKHTLINDVHSIAKEFTDVCFVVSFGRRETMSESATYMNHNVIAYDYVSYTQHLNIFDAVIHHGGAGITYACIKEEKPCIVIPHDYDQFDFAARIEYFKLGYRVKKFNSAHTVHALKKLFSNDVFNLAKMNQFMKHYDPSVYLEKKILNIYERSKA